MVAETGSTNADMLALARAGAAEGLWLRADRQHAGRGRQGRDWASPVGNLYASTLVRLRPDDPSPATLALVAGVALQEGVSALLGGRAQAVLKWPNDLLVHGRKLAGMLLERVEEAVVIGVGVNVAQHPNDVDRPATSLSAHGVAVTPQALLERLAALLEAWIALWRRDGLAPVIARWSLAAHPIGTPLRVHAGSDQPINGTFQGLDAGGALRLGLADGGVRAIHAGDVFLV